MHSPFTVAISQKENLLSTYYCAISSDCASCTMEGERCECDSLFFFLRWCRPAVLRVRSSKGRMFPSPRVHHRSPGVLAISPSRVRAACSAFKTMLSWSTGVLDNAQVLCRPSWEPERRTWRIEPRGEWNGRTRRTRSPRMGRGKARTAHACSPTRGSVAGRRNSLRSCCRSHRCEASHDEGPQVRSVARCGYVHVTRATERS